MATNEDLEKIKAALENFEVNDSNDTLVIETHDDDLTIYGTDDILNGSLSSYQYNIPSYTGGNVTISSGATGSTFSTGYNTVNSVWNTTAAYGVQGSSDLQVTGDAEFNGDIKWKGRSLGALLRSIEDRLAILQDPDPAKLEKHAALKKAYDHYKTLERLIGDD
jgi:hypothetical protein